MQVDSPARIRNIAITGHNDTGKTTLASALLYASGATPFSLVTTSPSGVCATNE